MPCFFAWSSSQTVSRFPNAAMTTMLDATFQIDPEFKRLLPELSSTELAQLEENILREGCRDPIVVWNSTIVDGHHRYEICRRNRLHFNVVQMEFSSREDAMRWICLNQMGRRNLSQELRRYQIGKRYNVEKVLTAHNPNGRNQHSEVASDIMMRPPAEKRMGTAASVGKEYNISHFAVHAYKEIATSIDTIAEKDNRLAERYLSGQLRIKKDDLITIASMTKWQVRALTNSLLRQNKTSCRTQDILEALSSRDLQLENQTAKERRRAQATAPMPSVKDMPVYSPDSEVTSLSLTVPSWRSSIDRTFSKTNMQEISDKARTRLRIELLSLRDSIEVILLAIEEVAQHDRDP